MHHLLFAAALLGALVSGASATTPADGRQPALGPPAATSALPTTATLPPSGHLGEAPAVHVHANEPPPSAYDRSRGTPSATEEEGRSLISQIWRTVFSLALVVALIYGLGKLALWRLGRGKARAQGGLKVVERMQLDARHALFVVEVSGKHKYLLGVGHDKGVSMLADLGSPAAENKGAFAQVLAQTSNTQLGASGVDDGERS